MCHQVAVSPEFGVLGVHHSGTFSEDFGDSHSADLLLNGSRNLLDLRDDDLLQDHPKHAAGEQEDTRLLTRLDQGCSYGRTDFILDFSSCWL